MNDSPPLILGGHSFFSDLGNEPVPDEGLQAELVAACLDHGITWFDTTHQPERLALGKALNRLGRRGEATVIAWNFMAVLKPGDTLDRPVCFEPHHLAQLQDELQTDFIDALVAHRLDGGTEAVHARLTEQAARWKADGHVGSLGVWSPGTDPVAEYGSPNPYDFMVKPLNVRDRGNGPAFAASKACGWQTYACSPFVRGWELDKLVAKAQTWENEGGATLRSRVADFMLRFALYHPHVDRVITAMRHPRWIAPNLESVKRGPLTQSERAWLDLLTAA